MQARNKQGSEAYTVEQAYRAGQNQQAFYNKRGKSNVVLDRDGAYLEAGDGENYAQAYIPAPTITKTEHVPTRPPLWRRKAFWVIIVLLLIIAGGVVAGVLVHEYHKSKYGT